MSRVLVLDNGSYNIKVGYATQETPYVVPNCVVHNRHNKRSSLVGSQFTYASNNNNNNSAIDYSGLVFQRPHERGQLVDWRLEFGIWNSIFAGKADKGTGFVDPIDPTETSLILTETAVSLPQVSANTDQMVFEEYGFKDYYRCTAGSLVPWNDFDADLNGSLPQTPDITTTPTTATINDNKNEKNNDNSTSTKEIAAKKPALSECALVIDTGFHATNVLPTILGEVYWPAAQQISVGGRLLTNYLREIVSFQQFNMMEETFLINVIKERTCFVATDFEAELAKCKRYKTAQNRLERDANPYLINYALPESPGDIGHIIKKAEDNAISGAQTLRLSNERFSVPELLFAPHHVGLDQAGLAETVVNCLNRVPIELQSLFAANIVLVGGTANLPGVAARLERELTPLLPDTYHLRVRTPLRNPELYAWQGGRRLALQDGMLEKVHVTRDEYMEYGEKICAMKFNMKRLDTDGAGVGDGSNYDSSDLSE
jgi:actin-related protein 6